MRAEPVAGAFVATIVLCALLATPVLVVALIIWIMVRASGASSSRPWPEVDAEFSARFHELEQGVLDAGPAESAEER
jgi:hypothetical protein